MGNYLSSNNAPKTCWLLPIKRLAIFLVTRVFDYTPFHPFLSFPLNNVGNPFLPTRYYPNIYEFEREVVGYFAALSHAKPEVIWGYVIKGDAEGNMYGIYPCAGNLPRSLSLLFGGHDM